MPFPQIKLCMYLHECMFVVNCYENFIMALWQNVMWLQLGQKSVGIRAVCGERVA